MIRDVQLFDGERISEIYNYYITQTAVSFETEAVNGEVIRKRIADVLAGDYPYYVSEIGGRVVGYCYLHRWNTRCAYDHTAELSIYVDKEFRGKGVGKGLITHLLENFDKDRFHTLIAGIALPNEASVAIHEKFGFKQISCFKEVGFKFDKWRDVGHWQLML